ncbi:hypothetical protein WA538_004441, partial [Blastocystis sp. DL]
MTTELLFEGKDCHQVEIVLKNGVFVVPRHILLLHASRLCDLIRSSSPSDDERLTIRINRECKYFQHIVTYLNSGFVMLPEEDRDVFELLMDIAYFKLTDMAERVKYLLSLRELSPHDFEKNQIRSAAATIAQCSRLTLKVSDPVFYANTTPPPIVVSNPSYVHPNFFLQLSVQCSRESYVWAVCSSHRDMSIPQIQEAGQKFCVLGDVPFQMTLSLAEAISSDVHVHLVARDLAGNLVATHASIPFTLQTTRPLTSESIDLPASPLLFEKPTDTPSLLSAPVSSRLLASVSSVTSTLPETALNTVCSKSELLSLLSQAALLPSAEFPVTSIIAEGIGKETAEQLVAAVSQRLFPQLETLNVADNDMGTAITVELLKSLRAGFCPQLRHLVMHDNRIGSSVGSLLAELLAEDSKCALKTLDVKHNRLKEGMATIVESIAFRVNTTLETFLFADNDETKAVVTRFIELLAEGHLPNLQHVEWSTACSSPFSFDLLQRIRANAPSLSLLLTNVSFSEISHAQLTEVIQLITAGLFPQVGTIQWTQGPSTLHVTPQFIQAARACRRLAANVRIAQIRTIDFAGAEASEMAEMMNLLKSGVFPSIQAITLSNTSTVSMTCEMIFLLNQFVYSGYFSHAIHLKESIIKGVELTDQAVDSFIVLLQVGLFANLEELDFRDCHIHDETISQLGDALTPLSRAVTVRLYGNPIEKPDTWFAFAQTLCHVSLGTVPRALPDSNMDMLLDVVYRQGRELRLEDVDAQTLQSLGRVLQSGALSCLRSLSVSQTCVTGEENVVEFIACLDEKACDELQQLDLVFSGANCGIGDASIQQLAEVIKNGSLPRLQFLSLSDCYITMNSDTMLIKALKAAAKRMRKLCIKTRRSSTVPSCVNLLQTHQLKKTLR